MSLSEQHYYQRPGHIVAAGVALSLADVLVVTLRFMARRKGKQPFKADDWLLLPALLLTVGVGICLVFGVSRKAFGYHQYESSIDNPSMLALEQLSTSLKLEWSISILLPIALGCTKASFLFFYSRIFSVSRRNNRLLMGLASFVAAWAVAFFLATLLCCKVMAVAIWRPVSEMSQCQFFLDVLMAFCITGFSTDVVIITIPIPLIWRLKLSRSQKLIASGSFLLGTVTIAAALARLIVSVQFVQQVANPDNDRILNISLYCYWGMVECSIGILAACLPTLQLYFRQLTWQSLASRAQSLLGSPDSGTNKSDLGAPHEVSGSQRAFVGHGIAVVNEKRDSSTPSASSHTSQHFPHST